MSTLHARRVEGFTLIEVLISMLIMGIGLLGLSMLQGRALLNNQDALMYAQSNLLAYELSDRIKANAVYWRTALPTGSTTDPAAGGTDVALATTSCLITTSTLPTSLPCQDAAGCTTDCGKKMAARDVAEWRASVHTALGADAQAIVTDAGSSYNIQITWTGKAKDALGNAVASSQVLLDVTP